MLQMVRGTDPHASPSCGPVESGALAMESHQALGAQDPPGLRRQAGT